MYYNFKRLRPHIEWALETIPALSAFQLTPLNWKVFEEITRLLEPFEHATRVICGDKYSTLCHVIPVLRTTLDHIKNMLEPGHSETLITPEGKSLCKKLVDNVIDKFPLFEFEPLYSVSTLLNPCYKAENFADRVYAKRAREETLKALKEMDKTQPRVEVFPAVTQTEAKKGFDVFAIMDKQRNNRLVGSVRGQTIEHELDLYLAAPCELDRQVDVFKWWFVHRNQYPRLYVLTECYLIIPASSASSERVFSAAGYLTDKRRNRLGNKSLNSRLFLKFQKSVILVLLLLFFICRLF